MPDSHPIDAERGMQRRFIKAAPLAILLLPLCVLLFAWLVQQIPDRKEIAPRTTSISFEPLDLDAVRFAPLELAGAWKLSSKDPAVGGISALALEPGGLIALSDSGAVISFPKPEGETGPAFVRGLPGGPGSPGFKRHRDTEALLAHPSGRGWWVAFENHDQIWLYDERLQHAVEAAGFGSDRWHYNSGIEAMTAEGGDLVVIPEPGSSILRIRGGKALEAPLPSQLGRISDAAALPGGKLLLLERDLTWRGFANALVVLEREGETYRLGRRVELPLGPLDNVEALAVEPLAGGALRLWLMTDDNFQQPLRTLLIALDVPPGFADRPGQ